MGGKEPVWNEEFSFEITEEIKELHVKLWDDVSKDTKPILMGSCVISILPWILKEEELHEEKSRPTTSPTTVDIFKAPKKNQIFVNKFGKFEGYVDFFDKKDRKMGKCFLSVYFDRFVEEEDTLEKVEHNKRISEQKVKLFERRNPELVK